MRERPNRPDVWQVLRGLLLLAFTMIGTAGAAHGQDDALHDMNALGYVLAFCAAAPFITVPMLPLPSLAVSSVAVATYMSIGYAFGPVIVALGLVTVVAAASTPLNRAAAVFVPVVAVVTTGLTIRFVRDPDESGWVALLAGIAWIGAPWAVGAFIRLRSEGRIRTRREEAARAVDEERLRIAAEVHDVAGHGLAVIAMQAGVALHVLDRKPEQARIALEEIRSASTEALEGLRTTLAQLRTPGADAPLTPGLPGLADLPALVDRIGRAGVPVDLRSSGQAVPVSPDVDHTAYRIVQESLTNVLRHANATRVSVTTTWDPDALTLTVRDDGATAPGPAGGGITGMQRRAESVGGTLRAAASAEGGFEVVATLPVAP
jgi:signal transduction histidine kinase